MAPLRVTQISFKLKAVPPDDKQQGRTRSGAIVVAFRPCQNETHVAVLPTDKLTPFMLHRVLHLKVLHSVNTTCFCVFVWISEQTTINSTNSIRISLVFIIDIDCIHCAV